MWMLLHSMNNLVFQSNWFKKVTHRGGKEAYDAPVAMDDTSQHEVQVKYIPAESTEELGREGSRNRSWCETNTSSWTYSNTETCGTKSPATSKPRTVDRVAGAGGVGVKHAFLSHLDTRSISGCTGASSSMRWTIRLCS